MNGTIASTAPAARPWGRAFGWLAFLGPFFFASYGLATWLTAQRADVGAIAFDWERAIPFVPWTIVPYWSIDLLYGLSLFACADRRELDTHARRLLTAQLAAIGCFLLFPLRFTFDRPAAEGIFGWLFRALAGFDLPYNQAPSLHVALLVILWALFARKLGPAARIALHGWFALIGVSVLTTWQHHFIDLPTGALLGFFCLWLWPQQGPAPWTLARWTADPTRRRLAWRYGMAATAVATVAVAVGGAALWLWWIAVALLLVALNYAAFGVEGFQKVAGLPTPGATALLAPYLVGAYLNSRLWTRSDARPVEVADGVWLGRLPSRRDLDRQCYAGVVDLSAELPLEPGVRVYANFPVLDLTVPSSATLAAAAAAIERQRAAGPVLVCCALGYSRSASAVAAWLWSTGRVHDVAAATDAVRRARPRVVLSDAHRAAIAGIRPLAGALP